MQTQTLACFQTGDYRRSRKAYTLECMFEYFVSLMVTDSFLAKVLTSLGFSDAQTGLISSFISLAFLFQLLAVPVVQKITHVKRFSALFHAASQLFFVSLYLVPFLPVDPALRRVLAVVCLLAAYFGNYFVSSIIYRWGNSFVQPQRRAIFGANKEMISLFAGMLVSLAVGYMMDYFTLNARLSDGFVFVAISIAVFSACDFVGLMLIKNETVPQEQTIPVHRVVKSLVKNRAFCQLLLLGVLWNAAIYMTYGFLGTYKLSELLFTVGQVQIINLLGSVFRFALSRPFGRYSDKHSFAGGMELAIGMAIAAFAMNIFTSTSTRYLIVVFTLLYHGCQAGASANLINMTYSYVDAEYFVQANALKNSISGLAGFAASLVGSRILLAVQSSGNQLFGLPIYGQQVLSLISTLILLAALLLTHCVIRKQRVMMQ